MGIKQYSARQLLPIISVILAGLVITIFSVLVMYEKHKENLYNIFNIQAEKRIKIISEGINREFNYLKSVASFYAASNFVDKDEFKLFNQEFLANNKIDYLAWMPMVSHDELEKFQYDAIKDFPDFKIKNERQKEGRSKYLPVLYVTPDKYSAIRGEDFLSKYDYTNAIFNAIDRNAIIPGGVFEINANKFTVPVFIPIYKNGLPYETVAQRRENIHGVVAGFFNISNIVQDSLSDLGTEKININIYDISDEFGIQMLYGQENVEDNNSSFSRNLDQISRIVPIGGHNWKILASSNSHVEFDAIGMQEVVILIIGSLFTFLIAGYLYTISGQKYAIEREVEERTAEIKLHRENLQNLVDEQTEDITRAKEDADRFANIARNNPSPIIKLNSDGEILLSNMAAEVKLPEVIRDGGKDNWFKDIVKEIKLGEVIKKEVYVEDTTYMQTAIKVSILDKEEVIIYYNDVTEIKNAQRAAEEANEAKTEFLSNMSHELRTPMHAILTFSNLGIDDCQDGDMESIEEYFKDINTSGNRLLKLINNLLDISKLEEDSTHLCLDKYSISESLNHCLKELRPLVEERSVKVVVEEEDGLPESVFDKDKIIQVIINLLSNSIKFSPEGSEIIIKTYKSNLKSSDEEDEVGVPAIFLSVQDNGIGIPKDELEKVFDKFSQSSKTKTKAGGTGLGLSVSRQIIELHRGRIWAENNEGAGVKVTFSIPVNQNFNEV